MQVQHWSKLQIDMTCMCYIFEKVMVRGPQKKCSWVSDLHNTQIQIHKYVNTALVKVADRQDMCYIFEKVIVREPIETIFPGV